MPSVHKVSAKRVTLRASINNVLLACYLAAYRQMKLVGYHRSSDGQRDRSKAHRVRLEHKPSAKKNGPRDSVIYPG